MVRSIVEVNKSLMPFCLHAESSETHVDFEYCFSLFAETMFCECHDNAHSNVAMIDLSSAHRPVTGLCVSEKEINREKAQAEI